LTGDPATDKELRSIRCARAGLTRRDDPPVPRSADGWPDRGRDAAFSTRLRDQVDLDTLSAELLAVVDQTMEPTMASLWLRPWTGRHSDQPTIPTTQPPVPDWLVRVGHTSTNDLPIPRRMLGVDLVGSRRIWPAQVGCLVGPDHS
jgi:hypothetical protein